jgi:hypothetical protein
MVTVLATMLANLSPSQYLPPLKRCDHIIRKNAQYLDKVAKTVGKTKKAKISTSKLNFKVQNIYIKPILKPEDTYNKPCFETAYLGLCVKISCCKL